MCLPRRSSLKDTRNLAQVDPDCDAFITVLGLHLYPSIARNLYHLASGQIIALAVGENKTIVFPDLQDMRRGRCGNCRPVSRRLVWRNRVRVTSGLWACLRTWGYRV